MKKLRFIFLALLFFLARPEGVMASDGTWQGKQYLKADGNQAANEWVFDAHYQSWFYIKADANYAENEWLKQGDDYFYLKSGGYMAKSEWIEDKGAFYYLDQNGKMKRNAWVGTSYVGATGAKVIEDWVYDSQYDAWFYIKADGQHAEKEWLQIKGKDYYFKSGGYLLTSQWIEQAYVSASGAKVQQGWLFDKQYQSWFYIKENGNHADKEWIQDGNRWYYLLSGGYLATRQWIGDYFVNGSGAMMAKEWLFDPTYQSMFYLNADGRYARKEWVQIDGDWYYFKGNGARAEREWVGNYYLGDAGVMATGVVTVGDTKYTFSNSGTIEKQEKANIGWVQKNGQRYFYNNRSQQIGGSNVKKVIDVSEHNGKIQNWSQVIRDNGVDGVIVRLGYYAYDEDKQLAYNIKELNRLGIPYGVYLYTYAENESDAELEAKHTIKLMQKYHIQPTYPIYYDVENWEYENKSKKAPADTDTWVKIINKYMETMKHAGYQNVKVYSYRQLLQTRLNHPDILQHVNWVAAYTDALDWNNPHYSGEKGWQYTSSDSLKGIRGRVDVSVWY